MGVARIAGWFISWKIHRKMDDNLGHIRPILPMFGNLHAIPVVGSTGRLIILEQDQLADPGLNAPTQGQ